MTLQEFGNFAQKRITGRMSLRVVEAFEVIPS
jgi:hypothetical protein